MGIMIGRELVGMMVGGVYNGWWVGVRWCSKWGEWCISVIGWC